MSGAYQINGVTITPQGGGYYDLTHPSLSEPQRERGKENAEAAAEKIGAAALQVDTGASSMSGSLDLSALSAGLQAEQQQAAAPPPPPPAPTEAQPSAAEIELAALKQRFAEEQAARVAAENLLAQTKTVVVDTEAEPMPAPGKITAAVPRKFDGILDDAAKAELKRLGIETTEIILEENENIPPTGLFVGHNGRGYMILPGEPVTVPDFLLGVLNDAQMAAPVTDPKSLKVVGYRNRMRYPYRRV